MDAEKRPEPDLDKELRMDLYLEFRKMVRPIVIEEKKTETIETEDFSPLRKPDQKEQKEKEDVKRVRPSYVFAR